MKLKLLVFGLILTSMSFGQTNKVRTVNNTDDYFIASFINQDDYTCSANAFFVNAYYHDMPPNYSYTYNNIYDHNGNSFSYCKLGGILIKKFNSPQFHTHVDFCVNGNFAFSGSKTIVIFVGGTFKTYYVSWNIPKAVFFGSPVCIGGSYATVTISD